MESSSSSSFSALNANAQEMHVEPGKQVRMASLCLKCGKTGVTRMLFLTVPKFGDLAISSFKCHHCGFFGRDVQQMAEIQDYGKILELPVKCARDLSRGVVKASTCSIEIPEIGFEIEARPMSGVYTTVEGLVKSAADNLGLL